MTLDNHHTFEVEATGVFAPYEYSLMFTCEVESILKH
jgi:hypothetical protein